MSSDGASVTSTILRGASWNYAAFGASKLAVLASTLVLARLLVPEEFGLIALGLLVLSYLDALGDLGMASWVIYSRNDDDPDERVAAVAFTCSMASSLLLAGLVVLVAPVVARFFGEPELIPVLRVLAVALPLASLSRVHEARLQRDLDFRRRMGPELSRAVTKGTVAIVLALLGAGVWSLVWGQLAGASAAVIGYWRVTGWRPRLGLFDRRLARRLLSYGGGIVLVGLLGAVLKDVDYLIVGRMLGADALGFYTLAFRVPELAVLSTCYALSQAVFPVFSSLQADRAALRRGFLRAVGILVLLTMPIGCGIAVVAPDLVHVLYGERWLPAIPVVRVLALYTVVASLAWVAGDVYKATGRVWLLSAIGAVRLPIELTVLIVAARWGIVGVAVGHLLVSVATVVVEMTIAWRAIGTSGRRILSALWPASTATAGMVATAIVTQLVLAGVAPFLRLVVTALVGAAAYGAIVFVLHRDAVAELRGRLIAARRPSTPTNAHR